MARDYSGIGLALEALGGASKDFFAKELETQDKLREIRSAEEAASRGRIEGSMRQMLFPSQLAQSQLAIPQAQQALTKGAQDIRLGGQREQLGALELGERPKEYAEADKQRQEAERLRGVAARNDAIQMRKRLALAQFFQKYPGGVNAQNMPEFMSILQQYEELGPEMTKAWAGSAFPKAEQPSVAERNRAMAEFYRKKGTSLTDGTSPKDAQLAWSRIQANAWKQINSMAGPFGSNMAQFGSTPAEQQQAIQYYYRKALQDAWMSNPLIQKSIPYPELPALPEHLRPKPGITSGLMNWLFGKSASPAPQTSAQPQAAPQSNEPTVIELEDGTTITERK